MSDKEPLDASAGDRDEREQSVQIEIPATEQVQDENRIQTSNKFVLENNAEMRNSALAVTVNIDDTDVKGGTSSSSGVPCVCEADDTSTRPTHEETDRSQATAAPAAATTVTDDEVCTPGQGAGYWAPVPGGHFAEQQWIPIKSETTTSTHSRVRGITRLASTLSLAHVCCNLYCSLFVVVCS